jgi:hypothetical protein
MARAGGLTTGQKEPSVLCGWYLIHKRTMYSIRIDGWIRAPSRFLHAGGPGRAMNFIEILDSYVENRFGAVLRCVAAGGPLFWPTGPRWPPFPQRRRVASLNHCGLGSDKQPALEQF